MLDVEEYRQFVHGEVSALADAEGQLEEDVFFDYYTNRLIDEGVIRDATRLYYCPRWCKVRIDGYAEVDDDHDGVNDLTLFICDYRRQTDGLVLNKGEADTYFKYLKSFVKKALDKGFRDLLDVDDPGFVAADLISNRWAEVDGFNLVLLSDRPIGPRLKVNPPEMLQGKRVKFDVWDLERLRRLDTAGGERVPLEVDFSKLPSGPLPALRAQNEGDDQVFLLVVPGDDLARIYDDWGNRLLEQNVRVFLQARSNVNKGIKATIENDPQLFLAYNNGITATGTRIELLEDGASNLVKRIDDLQIVNGGQTTSSIYSAFRRGVDLSDVFVQMKLVVVDPSRAAALVPRISEYANSQNKVTGADLMSNQEFQIRMEELSRRLYAPQAQGATTQTLWFYERARGQYQDEIARRTGTERRAFKTSCPTGQKITKSNLADYLMAWTEEPWYVALGQAKNMARFNQRVQEAWKKNSQQFDRSYWHMAVAKAIIWKCANRLVRERDWYKSGMFPKAHAIYGIARFSEGLRSLGRELDYEIVWQKQGVPGPLAEVLGESIDVAHEVLLDDGRPTSNVQEWAKKPEVWERLKKLDFVLPDELLEAYTC